MLMTRQSLTSTFRPLYNHLFKTYSYQTQNSESRWVKAQSNVALPVNFRRLTKGLRPPFKAVQARQQRRLSLYHHSARDISWRLA